MKIMVVGSSGYIGRHVVKKLAAQGAEVVAFDLVSAPPQWSVAGVPFVQGNMTNLEEVMAAVLENGIQRMVALGYYMTPLLAPECRDLLNAARVNIIGVTNLFEAARLAKMQRIIFASTVGIFGYQDGYGSEPIDENTEPRAPKSLYGLMKLVNNGLAERYSKTYGVQIVKVHSAAVIGPGNTAFSKRMIQDPALGKPGFANWPSNGPRNIVGVGDIAQLYTKLALAERSETRHLHGHRPKPNRQRSRRYRQKISAQRRNHLRRKSPRAGMELRQLQSGERVRLENSVRGGNGAG